MVFRAMAVLATLLLGVAAPGTAHAARDPDCPVEPDACEFVRSVVVALDSGDRSALLPLLATEEVVCPAPDSGGLGGPFPLCDGAAEGERRVGVPISRINSE